jgi:hypothetical protein
MRERRRIMRGLRMFGMVVGLLLGLLLGPAWADIITFNTFFSEIPQTASSPLLPTDPANPTHGGAFSPAWTWDYTGTHSGSGTVYHGLINNSASSNTALTNAACPLPDCSSNDNGNFKGWYFLYFNFALPSDATNVVLHLNYLDADDRVVLSVNNTQLGGFAYSQHGVVGTNPGYATFQMDDASGTHSVAFFNTYDIASPFHYPLAYPNLSYTLGGENYLRFWVNDTHSGLYGNAVPHISPGLLNVDPSALYAYGYISYDRGASNQLGDFTGDGKPDLLWQHATTGDVYLWTMNGTTQTGGTYLAQGMGPWKVVATGDFCGTDGKTDLVWQHDTSGEVYLWCMNGTTVTSGTYLAQGMGAWKVVGAADLTGDGKPDLLWQHATSGDVYLWTMNGTTPTSGTFLAQGMGSWKVVAIGDFTGDGKPDLLWQHATSGDVYLWTMNGTTMTSGSFLSQGMGPWKVVGPK